MSTPSIKVLYFSSEPNSRYEADSDAFEAFSGAPTVSSTARCQSHHRHLPPIVGYVQDDYSGGLVPIWIEGPFSHKSHSSDIVSSDCGPYGWMPCAAAEDKIQYEAFENCLIWWFMMKDLCQSDRPSISSPLSSNTQVLFDCDDGLMYCDGPGHIQRVLPRIVISSTDSYVDYNRVISAGSFYCARCKAERKWTLLTECHAPRPWRMWSNDDISDSDVKGRPEERGSEVGSNDTSAARSQDENSDSGLSKLV
ncbi:hypothetical protein I302_100553 [Kwoniella bestiolae CBS 10118]|uniref:Uncharacterized protein n=1 Tax=Kwoniella bestiolae CBS 10118 TaxID=1296100 RepID=A0A1B9G5E0_9TREE|nr:hypothetical protein I302_03928 [Kwoniella bestiolae CBS 10118]OCF26249.1 hypothetical protein I302_03928 [Kwoniella bestiolae CBS 10118]